MGWQISDSSVVGRGGTMSATRQRSRQAGVMLLPLDGLGSPRQKEQPMASRLARFTSAPPTAGPIMCPEGGSVLTSSPALMTGHPLHRRVDVAAAGTALTVRPVLPGDAAAVADLVRGLAPQTAYRRFHAPVSRLTSEQLAGIVDVDHHDRETLVAEVAHRRGPALIAIAQYIRIEPAVADMAIVVADAWQRRGVGRIMAARLAEAAEEEGIERFDATVLADNTAPQRLARGLSATMDTARHGTTIDMHIALGPSTDELVGLEG
jgi:RimJ/RimL family protein N-acetyltransferase